MIAPRFVRQSAWVFSKGIERIKRCGVVILTRHTNRDIAAMEDNLIEARPLSNQINAWESRWPLNPYRDRDATKLSRAMVAVLNNSLSTTRDGTTAIRILNSLYPYGSVSRDRGAELHLRRERDR